MNIDDVLAQAAPIMPVLTIDDADHAVRLADALLEGGISVVEITLRTAAAIEAIEAVRRSCPEVTVGAGTVLSPLQMRAVRDAGGQFAVSPGFTSKLAKAAQQTGLPYLPGTVTAGEIQHALEHDLTSLKFFPAEAAGGAKLLSNFAAVFPDLRFCPTGGIGAANAHEYLSLKNVVCVGGSFVAPSALVRAGDWAAITRHTREALAATRAR